MSKFADKIFNGQTPTDEDWTEHLIESHQRAPSMTPQAFAGYRTIDGLNSYELLASTVNSTEKGATIVDLACGDGHLIQYLLPKLHSNAKVVGVDISEAELTIAKKNYSDSRITFFCAKAQSLPFEDQSVDLVLSHMAFMLMLPIEPIIKELSRVLKSQGKFVAIIGNSKAANGLFDSIQKVIFQFVTAKYPKIKEARSGDPRVCTMDGVRELFSSHLGFTVADDVNDFELIVDTSPQGVWNLMKDMYFIGMLPKNENQELKEMLLNFIKNISPKSKNVRLHFPMRKFSIVKH